MIIINSEEKIPGRTIHQGYSKEATPSAMGNIKTIKSPMPNYSKVCSKRKTQKQSRKRNR